MMTRNRSQPAQIKARLLGQVQFLDGKDRELRLATRKARALLAFLIVEADRWHARDKLSGLLWGDRQQAQARHSLTQALGAIRRLEKIAGVSLLETGREHVRLRANAVDCDHSILCQALKANSYSVATAFTAPLMDGMDAVDPSFDEWLANQRNALSSSICSALRLTAAAAEKAGEHTDTISATQIWLSLEPSSEDAHRRLMRAYFAAGDRTAAIRQYQACERALRDDLGVTPSPETSALLDAIRSGTPSTTVAKQVGTEPDRGYAAANDPFPPSPRRVPRDTDLISLAVLPFENLSADPEQDFLCDGMAEDIINALSSLSGLRVIARQSTSRYRSQKMDTRRIADDLRVRYVLGGSIRRAGTRLRISAQLIDTVDETQAWADRYDREIEDIFDIQDEVMKEIVTARKTRSGSTSC
jgi:TolB-like protein/DNA-binding SARP family transcriptional activator